MDDLHGEDGSHDAMCNSYHGSMGVVGSDVDASLVCLSSCDWRCFLGLYLLGFGEDGFYDAIGDLVPRLSGSSWH